MNDTLGQEALESPQVGDYWAERVYCPYFLIVKIDGEKITILDGLDRIVGLDSWEFDYSMHKVVDLNWMKSKVLYKRIPGFVAEVRRGDKFLKIVEEWKQFQRARIMKSLEEFA